MTEKQQDFTEKAMREVADQAIEACVAHEREAHAGHVCMPNRVSAVAFFAHCLGVSDMVHVAEMLEGYKQRCQEGHDAH